MIYSFDISKLIGFEMPSPEKAFLCSILFNKHIQLDVLDYCFEIHVFYVMFFLCV